MNTINQIQNFYFASDYYCEIRIETIDNLRGRSTIQLKDIVMVNVCFQLVFCTKGKCVLRLKKNSGKYTICIKY
jgi:hypothetical protein